ncbi:MAG: family 10 glycosylhydrolase [Planctomycetes bacterium]|nr:family 10 glycosylhydrolase [Planctomycetota bacterium]
MNRVFRSIGIVAATALAACACLAGGAHAAAYEGRAMYVTRWYLRAPADVEEAVSFARQHGFNQLFCQVFGDAMALYPSARAPRSPLVAAGFDALDEAVRRGHAAGLEVHAYMNTACVWSGGLGLPADPTHVVRAHPEWSMEDAAGERDVDRAETPGALVFFCPRQPGFVTYLADIAGEIAAGYAVDGIHLDYIRYPTEGHCFCRRHRDDFRSLHGREPVPGDPEFQRFREDDVLALVRAIGDAARAFRPGIRLSATLIAPSGRKGQDAKRWLEEGAIDIGVPML